MAIVSSLTSFVTWSLPEYYRDLIRYRLDVSYMWSIYPEQGKCPFAGGDLQRSHGGICRQLDALSTQLPLGTAVRGNVLGAQVLASHLHESALGLPERERALGREVVEEAVQVALRRIDDPEVWQEIEAGFLETTPENLRTWWNSVLWNLLGMGTLNTTDSKWLINLRTRILMFGSFLPNWRVCGYLVADKPYWLDRIRAYYPDHTAHILDTVLLAGGLSIPMALTAGLKELPRFVLTAETVEAFVYETLRVHAPVGTVAYSIDGTTRRQMLGLRAGLRDTTVWGEPAHVFDPKPLDVYHRNFIGFADTNEAMMCPGKLLAMQVLQRLFLAKSRQLHGPHSY